MKHRLRTCCLYPVLIILAVLTITGVFGYSTFKKWNLESFIASSVLKSQFPELPKETSDGLTELVPVLLGLDEPRTFLILFQNNTELRPGGGFIGSYAIVHVERGRIELGEIEGTEIIDARAPKEWRVTPPRPITQHLGVDRWYFRDSNWSPDFHESAKQALAFYKAEGGVSADDIDLVIGITPTVLEELIAISGPITIDNLTFNKENVTETLEHEVEYGFAQKDIAFRDRKQIMEPFFHALKDKLASRVLQNINGFLPLAQGLIEEKQLLMYSPNEEIETSIQHIDADGEVAMTTSSDYLLFVDANLAALKTDHVIKRTLSYAFEPQADGSFLAHASMTYQHTGKFDWRTSRYRTYSRVFVPEGSVFVSASGTMKTDRTTIPGTVDQGTELGKQWFGSFISIEPGQTKTLSFTYKLPQQITDMIQDGSYTLLVQKELGLLDARLTLDLNFGTTILSAEPGEEEKEWGNDRYTVNSDFNKDEFFKVELVN